MAHCTVVVGFRTISRDCRGQGRPNLPKASMEAPVTDAPWSEFSRVPDARPASLSTCGSFSSDGIRGVGLLSHRRGGTSATAAHVTSPLTAFVACAIFLA